MAGQAAQPDMQEPDKSSLGQTGSSSTASDVPQPTALTVREALAKPQSSTTSETCSSSLELGKNGLPSTKCVRLAAGSKSVTATGGSLSAAAAAASAAFVAAKLGLSDQLESALAKTPGLACLRDAEGRCCLHYAAGYGHEVCCCAGVWVWCSLPTVPNPDAAKLSQKG